MNWGAIAERQIREQQRSLPHKQPNLQKQKEVVDQASFNLERMTFRPQGKPQPSEVHVLNTRHDPDN